MSELEFLVKCLLFVLLTISLWIINPLEKYNQKLDSDTIKTAQQYLDAVHTYYDKYGGYHWSSLPNGSECMGRGMYPDGSETLADLTPQANLCSNNLFDDTPLKDNIPIIPINILKSISLSYSQETNTNFVCFMPRSSNLQYDPSTVYKDNTGQLSREKYCKSQGGNNNCYWCAS